MKKLDRIEGTKALNEGFVIVFGEKHRELLETMGEELIELGLKNGKNWVNSIILKYSKVSSVFEMVADGDMPQEKADDLEKCMQVYFTSKEISMLKKGTEINDHSFNYTKGIDKYETIFIDNILESEVNIISPKPFDHFKEYIIYNRPKITLFGESGLGLDMYSKNDLKYYQEENELFYMIENIARKYHYFGMLLAKDNQVELWIEKIKNNLTNNTNYHLKSTLSQIIYRLIDNEKYADDVMIDIQNVTGVTEGFMTHKQLDEKLKKMDFSKLPMDLFSKK